MKLSRTSEVEIVSQEKITNCACGETMGIACFQPYAVETISSKHDMKKT